MVKVGSIVRHSQESCLGVGRVVALRRGAKEAVVVWKNPHLVRRHDLRVIRPVK